MPAEADQRRPLVAPPEALLVKVVVLPTSRAGAAGERGATATARTFTVRVAVARVPAVSYTHLTLPTIYSV